MKNKLLHLIKIGMYYSVMGFTLQVILLNTVLAVNTSAQDVKSVREIYISIELDNLDAIQAFEAIESKTNYKFAYEKRMIDKNVKINYKANNQSLADILIEISKVTNLKFRQVNNSIDVKKIDQSERKRVERVEIMTQTKTITGTVTAFEDGQTLPGVNVLEKGTTNGTVTDLDGRYSLNVTEGATLVFSSVGYTTEEVIVGSSSVLDMVLTQDIQQLGEIVVVGFGTQIKKDVTGSITSVKSSELKNLAVASPDALLQGKAAGVQVVQNSGTPGGDVFVRVRGTASLIGETQPLFVIDGVPMNTSTAVSIGGQRTSPLADINPNDIESMEILKDAAATAIYGARGANGVILITTKRGKTGQSRISFDAYHGVQSVWNTLDLLDSRQFADLLTESLNNRDPNLINNNQYANLGQQQADTDYQNEIFQTAPISNYSVSISGGTEKFSNFVSLGYFTQEGTIIGQKFNRFNGRLNLDYNVNDKLKIGTSLNLSSVQQNRVENDFSGLSILANGLFRDPNLPVYNSNGTYSEDPLQIENPVLLANEVTFKGQQRRIVANVYAELEIIKGLSIRSVLGMDYLDDRQHRFIPSFVLNRQGIAQADAYFLDEQTIINDNTITYNTTLNEVHSFTVLAGLGYQLSNFSRLTAGGREAGSNIVTTINSIAVPFNPNHNISDWALRSYFGRVNYSFNDKYLVEASFRIDGSSRFGEDNRNGFFPGFSLGWRVSEEAFMSNFSFITDMKLRAGVGVTGNQDGIGNFAAQALYSTGRFYDGSPGIGQANISNPLLGWESTTTTNIGVDLSLLNARVNVTAEAYLKQTSDLLFERRLPFTSGFNSLQANIADMENRGIELTLSTRNFVGDFKWTTDFNIAFNRNKITSLPENGVLGSDLVFTLPDAYGAEGPYNIYRVGEPVGSFYGYIFEGVYARDEDVPRIDDPENLITDLYERGVRGGDVAFTDLDNDGTINRAFDRVIIGNALPLHFGGFTNNFSYKGFDLNVIMNWTYGNDIYNMTRAGLTSMSEDQNQSVEVLRRWRQQGDITDVPKAVYGNTSVSGAANTDASSRYIEDGSFLRFRNITLGYNIPNNLLSKLQIASARVYVSGQNLITITNYSGLDPENQNLGTGIPTLGVDYLTQPQPRIYMVGINLGL